jgi:hypothetical protein
MFSFTVFITLLGSGFQQRSVLGFRVQRLLSSLAAAPELNYATGVFAEPFPGNSSLCWLQQICHNII